MNSITQKPFSQATGSSAGHEILRILWNEKVHQRTHNSPPLVAILIQMNPFQNVPFYSFQNQFNIIWNLHLGFPRGLYPSGCISIPQLSHVRQTKPPVSDQPSNISLARSITKRVLSHDFSYSSISFSVLGPNILLTLTPVHVCPDTFQK